VASVCCLAASTMYCLAVSVAGGGGVHWPPRGASVACCRLAWCGGDHWSFPRVSWLSVSSHLLHVTCVGDADMIFKIFLTYALASRASSLVFKLS